MKNKDIRNYAKMKGVNLWEVSERLGYAHETAFSRVLRHELPEDKKVEIMTIIDELSNVEIPITINDYMELMNEQEKQMVLAFSEQILLNKSSNDDEKLEK